MLSRVASLLKTLIVQSVLVVQGKLFLQAPDGESGILYICYCKRVKFRVLPVLPPPASIILKIM